MAVQSAKVRVVPVGVADVGLHRSVGMAGLDGILGDPRGHTEGARTRGHDLVVADDGAGTDEGVRADDSTMQDDRA